MSANGTLTTGKIILSNTKTNEDGFGRLRVSNPVTLFDTQPMFDKDPLRMEEIFLDTSNTAVTPSTTAPTSGNDYITIDAVPNSGSFRIKSTHIGMESTNNSSRSYIELEASATSLVNETIIRQSKEYVPYQPGKSRLCVLTGVMSVDTPSTGVVSRIGMFDNNCGHFFELNGTNSLSVVERKDGTDTAVIQSNWNVDVLDGDDDASNPSSYTVDSSDYTKAFIYFIDMEWLGVGKVRMGIFINGKPYIVHEFIHTAFDSNVGVQVPYIWSGRMPIRYEMRVLTSTSTRKMRCICSTIQSEGGYQGVGIRRSLSSSDLNLASNNVLSTTSSVLKMAPLILIRLKSEYIRSSVRVKEVSIMSKTADSTMWKIMLNCTFKTDTAETSFTPDSSSWTSIANSCIEYQLQSDLNTQAAATEAGEDALINSQGTVLSQGLVAKSQDATIGSSLEDILSSLPLVADYAGTSDTICLGVISFGSVASVFGTLNWIKQY